MVTKDSRLNTKIKRMDFILDQLQRGKELSTNDILKLMKNLVSKRTCERDIADLQDRYGGQILRGDGSKYYWSGEIGVKPFYMEKEEFWYIYMSVLTFNSYGLDENLKTEIMKKLENIISLREAEVFKNARESILFKKKGTVICENDSLINIFIKLIEHFSERNSLLLKYKNRNGEVKEHIVNIYGFCRAKESYYIIVKMYEFISFFRIDRIIGFSEIYKKYEIDESFNLQDYLKEAFEVEVTNNIVDFKLEIFGSAKSNILDRVWFENQKIEEIDGKIIFSARTSSEKELKKWILGFGSGVKVIAPENLKHNIIEEYKKAIEIY